MFRLKPISQPRQTVLVLALLLTAAFGAACGGAKTTSSSSSSTSSTSSTSSGAPGGGAFEGEITSKMSLGTDMQIKYAIKGTRTRIETQILGGDSQMSDRSTVTLIDLPSQTSTTLIPKTKTYMTMNWGETAEQAANEMGKDAYSDFSKVTPTGKTETVAGINCQYWKFGDKMEMCLAQGLGYFGGGGGGAGGILDKLKNLAKRDKIKAELDANPEFAKFAEGGAFPLKMANIENGQSKTFMEVTSVERKSLDDSLFTVPADYKKVEIPGIPGIPGMKR